MKKVNNWNDYRNPEQMTGFKRVRELKKENDSFRCGCQKEESLSDPGGVCTQAITVTIPQELQTRAMAADFGNGSAYAKR